MLVYGDCAVNTDPNPEQLAQIGITSAETAAAFGIEPRVAFLSYSTFGSGAGPDVDKVDPKNKVPPDLGSHPFDFQNMNESHRNGCELLPPKWPQCYRT